MFPKSSWKRQSEKNNFLTSWSEGNAVLDEKVDVSLLNMKLKPAQLSPKTASLVLSKSS